MAVQRLDKIIASTGRWSRREVKDLVRQGRVTVNGAAARAAEEKAEVRIPEFYHFGSIEERERILYQNFCRVGEEVKEMIAEIQHFKTR